VTQPAKPFVHPLVSPGGRTLTRAGSPTHPWQRGLWFAVKFVDGDNFWEEHDPYGVQREAGGGRVEWIRPDGTLALEEDRSVERSPLAGGGGGEVIDWHTELRTPGDAPVLLDRTPYTTWGGYGGLALRGAGDWADTRITLADGSTHRRPEGVPSRWCDLSGPDAGIALLDHPHNPRHPVPWYGATRSWVYGDDWSNFVNAAFLFHEPMTLQPGAPLRLRYRVIVHDGTWSAANVQDAWEAWVG
jgi:hypothetical protein